MQWCGIVERLLLSYRKEAFTIVRTYKIIQVKKLLVEITASIPGNSSH